MPRINMSAEQFQDTLDAYEAAGVPEEQQQALQWAWGYMNHELAGDYKRLAAAIKYDPTTVYRIFAGKYEASLDSVIEQIAQARKRLQAQVGFIDTPVTRRIFDALDYARDYRALVCIVGETGRSKTTAAKEWQARNNHGKSVYVRCVSSASRPAFARSIARALGIGISGQKTGVIEDRIFDVLRKSPKILVIDEAGHLLPAGGRKTTSAIEYVRDIHDECETGIALVMTDVYLDLLRTGSHCAFFEQFLGRMRYTVQIPRKIFRGEVQAFCCAFIGADPDPDLVNLAAEIAKGEGKLRTLADDMAKARNFARAKKQQLEAKHLAAARKWREAGGAWSSLEVV